MTCSAIPLLFFAARVVLISVVSVCMCLSVNTITPEPLEISSRVGYDPLVERADKCAGGEKSFLMCYFYYNARIMCPFVCLSVCLSVITL